MTQLAALALRLGRLPSEIEREDPTVVDEMERLLKRADRETPTPATDPTDLIARLRGR
jgi:hypothetical protein